MRDAQEAAVRAGAQVLLGRRVADELARVAVAVADHLATFAVELLAHAVLVGAIGEVDLGSGDAGLDGQRQTGSAGRDRGRQALQRGGDDGSVRCGHGMG